MNYGGFVSLCFFVYFIILEGNNPNERSEPACIETECVESYAWNPNARPGATQIDEAVRYGSLEITVYMFALLWLLWVCLLCSLWCTGKGGLRRLCMVPSLYLPSHLPFLFFPFLLLVERESHTSGRYE